MATTLRELVTRWGFDVDFNKLDKMEQRVRGARANFLKVGAAASAALAAAVVPAASLQASIRNTLTMTSLTGDAFTELERTLTNKSKSMSDRLFISGEEIAKGFYQVLSTGAKVGSRGFDALAETSLKLARTIDQDSSQTIEQLNSTIKAFNMNLTEAEHVANVFMRGQQLAATSVPQLTEAMRDAAPASNAFNVSLEETVGILDLMADRGFKGTLAGNAFRRIILRLAAPPADAKRALKEMNIELVNSDGTFRNLVVVLKEMQSKLKDLPPAMATANLKAIAGQFAFSQLGGILDSDLSKLDEWVVQLQKSGGLLESAFTMKMGAAAHQAMGLWMALKNLAATVGEPLLGPLAGIAKGVRKVITEVRELLQEHPNFTKITFTIGGVALSFVVLASAIGVVKSSITLARIAMQRFGVESLKSMVKAAAIPALLIIAAIGLGLLMDDLIAFAQGSDSVFGRMIGHADEFRGIIIALSSALVLMGFKALFAMAPFTAMVILLIVAGVALLRARKAMGEFIKLNEDTPWGQIASEFGGWVAELIRLDEVVKTLKENWESLLKILKTHVDPDTLLGKFIQWISGPKAPQLAKVKLETEALPLKPSGPKPPISVSVPERPVAERSVFRRSIAIPGEQLPIMPPPSPNLEAIFPQFQPLLSPVITPLPTAIRGRAGTPGSTTDVNITYGDTNITEAENPEATRNAIREERERERRDTNRALNR